MLQWWPERRRAPPPSRRRWQQGPWGCARHTEDGMSARPQRGQDVAGATPCGHPCRGTGSARA
eukprot:13107214-Alexandrium_andersonii.AAC.1